jgi:hypothetical protein
VARVRVEDVHSLIKPKPGARVDACLTDIAEAIDAIKAAPFLPRLPHARLAARVASKLGAAADAIRSLPREWHTSGLLDKLEDGQRALESVVEMSKHKKGGRDGTDAYRRKYEAANLGFELWLRWSTAAPTLDDLVAVAEALVEAATGKAPGDVTTACQQFLDDMKQAGYTPAKWAELRRVVLRTKFEPDCAREFLKVVGLPQ